MSFIYSSFKKTLVSLFLFFSLSNSLTAQTTLLTGDIAFSGYIALDGALPDQFSFVLLKNITSTTVIKFTDYGWRPNLTAFSSGANFESEITFTAGANYVAGTEITISGTSATLIGGGSAGTLVYSSGVAGSSGTNFLVGNLSLSLNGDQIFAYQGTFVAPTFIAGIHMNVYDAVNNVPDPSTTTAAAWDGVLALVNQQAGNSGIPASLTTGTNAIWIGTQSNIASERDNGRFICASDVSTIALARAALTNQANWLTSNTNAGFTLPTGCNYLNILGPSINVTGTPLTAFTSCTGTASAEQNFVVSGSLLTTDIVINAPTGFEISLTSGSGFASSLSLTQSGGIVPNTTIYVRMPASATGTPSGNITLTSTGATTVNVAVTGTVNPIPSTSTITAGGPTTFCTGGSVVLTSSSATGNLWSTGAITQSITVTTGGTYTVTVTAAGCTSAPSAGTTVTVNPIPATPTITAGGPITFCAGGSVTLTSSSATDNVWSTGETTQSITVSTAGTYTVSVTTSGCTSAPSAGTTVTVDALPTTANAGPDATACISPGTFTMAANVPSVGTGSWSQVPGGPATAIIFTTGSATSNIGGLTTAGVYTFRWTISNGSCTPSFDEMTITVNPNPAPFILAGGGTFCPGARTLTGPIDNNYTYTWQTSLSGIANPNSFTGFGGTTSTQAVTSSSNYRLRVTNQFGCSTTDTASVSLADFVFNGSLAVGDASQTGRMNRFGVVSTCAVPKAYPGDFITTGSRLYDSYTITNPRNVPVCATIGIASGCGTNMFSAAYSGSFNPASVSTNYLADPGSSFPNAGYYEATIPANGSIVVVVHEVNPGAGCTNYQLTVDVPRDLSVITATPPSVNFNSTSTLVAPAAGSYLWSPGGATTQTITTAPITATTKYYATLGYGNAGCTRLDSVTVNLTCTPPTITCPANISSNNTTGLCGRAVTYTPTLGGIPTPTVTYAFTGATTASGSGDGSGSIFNVGVTNVTLTATNPCGTASCSFTVTITDNQAPTVTVGTIGSCYPTVAVAEAAALAATSSTDNCPGALTEFASTVGTCSAVITVTTTDAAGNATAVTYNTRIDNTPPTVTVGTIGSCYPTVAAAEAAALAATSATDNCPGALTEVASTVGTCSAVITVTTTDACGNATAVTYNTRIDNTAPTVTIGTIGSCYPTVAAAEAAALASTSATDNCPGALTLTEVASTVGTCSAVITVTTTDPCGNATAVTYNTRIDNTAPTVTVGTVASCFSTVAAAEAAALAATSATDNCPGALTEVASTVGTCSAVITVTTTDACGNATAVTYNTRIDNTPPVMTCPAPVTVSCASAVPVPNIASVTGVSDNCGGVVTVTHQGDVISAQTCTNRYTITRTYRATDVCGNFTECTQIITVNDQTGPVITCPANITVTAIGSCTAVVNFTPTATDGCGGAVTITSSPASGTVFSLGTTLVTVTARDVCGNTTTCTFNVTVLDGQIPAFTPQPANRAACVGSTATFTTVATNATSYQWQTFTGGVWVNVAGAPTTATLNLTNVTQSMNGTTYRVIAIGLCTNTISSVVTLTVNPLPTITLTTSIPPLLVPGRLLSITATTNPSGGSFVWFRNGVIIQNQAGPILPDINIDGIGTYRTTYTDLNGCVSTSSDVVVGYDRTDKLFVYPNPNKGVFQVRFYNEANITITVNVYDAKGGKVYETKQVTTSPFTQILINLKAGARGLYLVEVLDQNGKRIGVKQVLVNYY